MDENLAHETLKSFVENTDNVIVKEAILVLNPELNESEDEKIRKEIIEFLDYGIWSETTIDKVKQSRRHAKWIDYLEKQKEQKDY